MTYRKILAAIDRTPQGEVVFQQALELAKQTHTSLAIFYCLSADEDSSSSYSNLYGQELTNFSRSIQENREREIGEIEQWLSEYCQKAIDQGVSADQSYKEGDAGRAICEFALDGDIDLVVVGRRGRQGLKEMVLGSVSNYVVHHAPCSVLVVQGIEPSGNSASAS